MGSNPTPTAILRQVEVGFEPTRKAITQQTMQTLFFDLPIFIWVLIAALFIGELLLYILFSRFFSKMNSMFHRAKGTEVMNMLAHMLEKSEQIDKNIAAVFEENKKDRVILSQTLHKMSLVRFNPFDDMGGKQSFCIVFLDANNSGILMTSLYAKHGVRTYARRIIEGKSEQPLSEEEEKAIEEAMNTAVSSKL